MNTAIQTILLNSFEEIKQQNPAYSLRAYANKLGISSGALSCILKGRRKISKKMALRLAANLELADELKDQFFSSFSDNHQPNSQSCDIDYIKLQMDHHKVISAWYHFAILSLINLDHFQSAPTWIAERLNISTAKVEQAMERMLGLGMIAIDDSGSIVRTHSNFETTDGIKSLSIRQAHRSNLELAVKSLDDVPMELRDLTAITMAIDISKLDLAKEKIRTFHDEISQILETGEKNEVYKMCVQLFPITAVKRE